MSARGAAQRCRLDACTVRVISSLTETDSGTLLPGAPKSAAGRRTVQLPPLIVPGLRDHLDRYAQPGDDGLVFVSPRGTRPRRSNFRRRVWLSALTKAGLPEIHFHDLRHTGNILTATAGASLRELMARMGHASTRAALVYLHDTDDRQRTIATVISDLAARAGAAASAVRGESGECNGHVRGTTASQVIFVGEFCLVELGGLEPLTPCLQSTARLSGTVQGLGWSPVRVHLSTAMSRRVGVGYGCHRGPLTATWAREVRARIPAPDMGGPVRR